MPIVDKELITDTPMEKMIVPNQSVGDFLMECVQSNIAEFGDAEWMVSCCSKR